jgi:hypothetical protein
MKMLQTIGWAGGLAMAIWGTVPRMPAIAAPQFPYTVQTEKTVRAKVKIGMTAAAVIQALGKPLRQTGKLVVYCITEKQGCRQAIWIHLQDGKVTKVTNQGAGTEGMKG